MCNELQVEFSDKNSPVRLFTGQAESKEKGELASWFRPPNSPLRLLFATSVFGMGIDIPDIWHVVCVKCPRTLQSLYQFLGRAGRNGQQAFFLLLWHTSECSGLDACARAFLGRGEDGAVAL